MMFGGMRVTAVIHAYVVVAAVLHLHVFIADKNTLLESTLNEQLQLGC
jgi:hypothetical protein